MSLVETLKQRVFEALDQVQPPARYKVLVIDKYVQRLFDMVLSTNEVLNRNVSTVEIIDSRRPSARLEAIYMIKPDKYTIDCLITDFTRQPPRYEGAHLFFLPGLTKELDNRIRNSNVARFVRGFDVKFLDFFPLESQLFTLDLPYENELFFNSQCHDLVEPELSKISNKLVSVCAALGEYPIVRFQKLNDNYEAHTLPYMLAARLQNDLDSYARKHDNFPSVSENRPRSLFLVLDRTIDPIAPLLHEFTYQAMAYDLLPIKDLNKFAYESEKGNNNKEVVEGVLHDKDSEWVALRHMHMQDAIDSLTSKLDQFKKDNPHLVDSDTQATVTDLQDMIANLPMFAEMKERFALHLQMANECMNLFQQKDLNSVADVEQTCATGLGSDGRKNKNLTDDMIALLVRQELSKQDKVRIIALYAIFRGGLIIEDLNKLRLHCGLDESDLKVISNLSILGAPTVKAAPKEKKSEKPVPPVRFHGQATGDVYETSRFVPGIKNIVDQLVSGTLDPKVFPFCKDEPGVDVDLEQHASLRNPRQRAAWAKNTMVNQIKQRILVFVIGGVTQSEARSMYELSKLRQKEVIIGGTSIITPPQFLRAVSGLTARREQLRLPVDQPLPRAPSFLMESDRDSQKSSQQQSQQLRQPPPRSASMNNIKPHAANGAAAPPLPTTTQLNDALKSPQVSVKKEKKKFRLFK